MFRDHYHPELDDPEPLHPLAALQQQVDAVTKLIAEAQRGVAATPGAWFDVLARMIDRGAATADTIDGAAETWRVLDDDEHAALRARLERTGGAPASVEELLDAAPAELEVARAGRRGRNGDA